jgi:hypothetical protein
VTGVEGKEGPAGKEGKEGLVWEGTYSSSTTYELKQVVYYEGSSWIDVKATNKGNTPAEGSEWWSFVAKMGAVGKEGKEGKAGPAGEVEVTKLGKPAQETLSEIDEHMEILIWCVIGTIIAGVVFTGVRDLLRIKS